jgi:hypothetical protein
MKCFSKKQWLLSLITVASIILSFAGVTHAQKQPKLDQQLSGSLSPFDPAAKLDPSLLHVPPMPEPNRDSSPTLGSTQPLPREVSYDIRTGSTKVGAISPPQSSSSTKFSPPSLGADSNSEP